MKNKKYIFITVLGVLLIIFGGYSVKHFELTETLEIISYLAIGLGSGLFGSGVGSLIKEFSTLKNPEVAKSIRIEENDERNIAIAQEAKSRAFTLMNFLYGGVFLTFILMKVELKYLLVMISLYGIVNIYAVIVANNLRKKM
ncbi:hypothetical protein [Parvimonas sp. C2]|uniref:hypothetical protein n=1 Tax=Parvimonas sp. C2 TaxID=3110692 RepID=UPI002B48714D|nr:hypothetical protein [Parvimonas sp. C2]MEB3073039.1 hypothetical protein [Parvimonas sp. C2]